VTASEPEAPTWNVHDRASVTINNYLGRTGRDFGTDDGRSDLPGGGAAPALLSIVLLSAGSFAVLVSTGAASFYVASQPAQWNPWLLTLLGVTAGFGTASIVLSLVFRMQRMLLFGAAVAEIRDLHRIARSGQEISDDEMNRARRYRKSLAVSGISAGAGFQAEFDELLGFWSEQHRRPQAVHTVDLTGGGSGTDDASGTVPSTTLDGDPPQSEGA
jgi:hypothetical protein